jgi:hypothetical protein
MWCRLRELHNLSKGRQRWCRHHRTNAASKQDRAEFHADSFWLARKTSDQGPPTQARSESLSFGDGQAHFAGQADAVSNIATEENQSQSSLSKLARGNFLGECEEVAKGVTQQIRTTSPNRRRSYSEAFDHRADRLS